MAYTFYGCLSREIEEDGGKQRTGLEFEVVGTDKLNFFLGIGNREQAVSERHEAVFQLFQEYGLSHKRFREVKGKYLGETGFQVLSVYFDTLDYARYRYGNWYKICFSQVPSELSGGVYDCSICDWGDEDDAKINSYCSIDILPEEQAGMLKELYRPYIPEESRIRKTDRVGAIDAGTDFLAVRFLYVGAALCVLLLDTIGNKTAFFDLGTKVSNVSELRAQYSAAEQARGELLADLRAINAANQATIFISHWHNDHTNAIGKLKKMPGGLQNLAGNTEWYVPESDLPSFTTVQNVILPASFYIWEEGTTQAPVDIAGNPGIQAGKINLLNDTYPHHQGVYVRVTLHSGKQVLLSGDTTYQGLPREIRTNDGYGYDCLQICHHGGDYYLRPADQDESTARSYIPTPKRGAVAVYSADGRTYGHPDEFFVGHYHTKGYAANNEWMLHLGAARGGYRWDFM